MVKSIADLSKRQAVTLLRLLYPIWTAVGMFSLMYVPGALIVAGNASATAGNILANEQLFRWGIVASLCSQLIHIAVVYILYKLFETVNKNNALLLVILGLVGVPIAMLNTLNQVAALLVLRGADFLQGFTTAQLPALAMLFLDLNAEGVMIASIFWGLWLIPLGFLAYRSGYFPKTIGVLLLIAGVGYMSDAFIHFISPGIQAATLPITTVMTMGEVLFILWLVIRGAELPKDEA